MSSFFANIPVWVLPLFIALLFVGLRASRTRRVPIAVIWALPLLGILTFRSIASLAPDVWIWIIASMSYSLGAWIGGHIQKRWIIAREARFVQVKGEWLTMTAIMVIFLSSFAKGTIEAIAPALLVSPLFIVLFIIVVCLPSGHFLGRTLVVLKAPLGSA